MAVRLLEVGLLVEAGGGGRVVEVEEVTILLGSLLWLLRPGRKWGIDLLSCLPRPGLITQCLHHLPNKNQLAAHHTGGRGMRGASVEGETRLHPPITVSSQGFIVFQIQFWCQGGPPAPSWYHLYEKILYRQTLNRLMNNFYSMGNSEL